MKKILIVFTSLLAFACGKDAPSNIGGNNNGNGSGTGGGTTNNPTALALAISTFPAQVTIGDTLAVTGSNFGTVASNISITVNGVTVKALDYKFTDATAYFATATIPAGSAQFQMDRTATNTYLAATVKSSTALTIKAPAPVVMNWTEKRTNYYMDGAALLQFDQAHEKLIGTEAINSVTRDGVRTESIPGNKWIVHLRNADKGKMTISGTVYILTAPNYNAADTTTIPYIEYLLYNESAKEVTVLRAYFQDQRSFFSFGSVKAFTASEDPKALISKAYATDHIKY